MGRGGGVTSWLPGRRVGCFFNHVCSEAPAFADLFVQILLLSVPGVEGGLVPLAALTGKALK